jgi:hypothetical protein
MTRLANLTSLALLDYVEKLLVCSASERAVLPPRAYLAASNGLMTLVDLPPLDGAEEHAAAGTILGHLMREHGAAHAVLQMPHLTLSPEGGRQEVVGLYAIGWDGRELGRRVLELKRERQP